MPPTPSVVQKLQLWALTWKNGRKTRYVSSPPISMFTGPTRPAHRALACVWTTALGREVVPEVNMIPAGSIGSAGRSGRASPSPNSVSKPSWPWSSCSGGAGSPLLSSVTTIHCSPGALCATIPASCGWVIAPTHRVCSAK